MGRIILSNSASVQKEAVIHYKAAGFEEDLKINETGYLLNSFNKLNNNKLSQKIIFDNGDFIITTGTCISIESNDDFLTHLYQSFDGNIREIRAQLLGCYLIIIKKHQEIYVFVDDLGTYKAFFYLLKGKFALATTIVPLAASLDEAKVNELNLLELSFQHSILGEGSIFEDIRQLSGDKYLYWNLSDHLPSLKEISTSKIGSIKDKQMEVIISELADLFKRYFLILKRNYKRPAINMTGGLDSRLILAAFMSAGIKPLLIYGKGNSPLTNTKDEDLEINKLISRQFDLDLYIMDWSDPVDFLEDESMEKLLLKYDEYFHLYGANNNIFREYENNVSPKVDFIEFGYFGEMLRNLPWLESYNSSKIAFKDLIDKYLYVDLEKFSKKGGEFKESVKEKIIKILHGINSNDDNQVSKDNFQRFHANYRYSADTYMANVTNCFNSSLITCGIPEIHDYILNIPFSIKEDASFQLRLIDALFPPLLEIPFFSHTQEWYLDREKFKLFPIKTEKTRKNNIMNILRKSARLKKLYHSVRILLPFSNKRNKEELSKSLDMRRNYALKIQQLQDSLNLHLINPVKFYGDVRSLIKYYQLLFLIKKLK